MAEQLALVKTYDFETDQISVSLIGNTDGFDVAYQGWTPRVTPNKRTGLVSEAITLRVQGTSTDAIATSLQKLADMAEDAQRYFTGGARDYAVWFRVQMSGETKGRQSLVYELRHEAASSVFDVGLRSSYHWNKYTLGIDRAPWWEGTACETITAGTVNTCGGTWLFSGTVKGDLNARWAQVRITNMGTHAIFPQGQVWVGIKSSRYGPAGSFVPFWSLAGTIAYDSNRIIGFAYYTADATAKGGTSAVFEGGSVTAGPYLMAGIPLCAVTSSPSYYRGDYRVLLRARLSGTALYLMQLKTGWKLDYSWSSLSDPGYQVFPNAQSYPRVAIEYSTEDMLSKNAYTNRWHFYDMGEVTIPPTTHYRSQITLDDFSLLVYAEWISGTGDLYLDGLVLIPLDGFMYAGYSQIGEMSGTALYAVQSPDGVMQAATLAKVDTGYGTADTWGGMNTPSFRGGMVPGTAALMVVAAESYYQSLTTTNVAVEIKYFERWKEIRGND